MEPNLKKLKCGQCGTYSHLLYQRENGEIIVECTKCKSASLISATIPEIKIRNLNGLGTLCSFD